MMQNSRNTYIQFKQYICTHGIILHPASVYLCSFKELYLFSVKEMIYLLTFKEILILSNNIYLFTRSIIIRGNYILTRNYIHFKKLYLFIQGNISSFNEIYSFSEIMSMQSRKYINLRNIYSFKFKAICSFKEAIFIEHCCIRGIAEIFIQKLSSATL